MTQEKATEAQRGLIGRIVTNTELIAPKRVLAEKSIAIAWIALSIYTLNDAELSKAKAKASSLGAKEIEGHISTLKSIIEISAPVNHDRETIRQWLKSLSDLFAIPAADKVLNYWYRALLYRDLNAFVDDKVGPITKTPVPSDLPNTLPTLSKDFEAPKSAKSGEPVALLIAFTPKTGKPAASALLGIPLAYDKATHSLVPPPEGALPFFNREWLEPPDPEDFKDVYFGSVFDCDDFFTNHAPPKQASWPEYWEYVAEFVHNVTGFPDALPNLAPLVHRRDTAWKIVEWNTGGASKKIADTYQRALNIGLPRLLGRLADKAQSPQSFNVADSLSHSGDLLGHIDTYDAKKQSRIGFGLEQSQRIAATAMTQVPEGKLLTVNGPPGTGKTSFLRAVIGTEYVQAALRGNDPALLLATAATNKAVTNIIESFAEISGPEMQPEWSSRWLPGLPSYGWFYPAASKDGDEIARYMVLGLEWREGERPRLIMKMAASDFYAAQQQKRHWMTQNFLDLHRRTLGLAQEVEKVDQAAEIIRTKLKESVESMRALQTLFRKSLDLPGKQKGFRKSELEWQQTSDSHTQQCNRLQEALTQSKNEITEWNKAVSELRKANLLRKKCSGLFYRISCLLLGDRLGVQAQELENSAIQRMSSVNPELSVLREDPLDVVIRLQKLTARRITETEEYLLKEKGQLAVAQEMLLQWSTWRAMVAKVLSQLGDHGQDLSNRLTEWAEGDFANNQELELRFEEALDKNFRFLHFHMAARYWEARWLAEIPTPTDAVDGMLNMRRAAMLAPVIVSTVYTLPGIASQEFEFADLLIFDESGQASPEIGAASFAYAKRAIVVGDIYQLTPVWNVGSEADTRLRADIGIDEIPEALNVSSGSVMKVAQTHTALSTDPTGKLGAGVGLVAHYRCRAAIIEYCRQLIYGEGLLPVRYETPPNNHPKFLYPPMAWVAVTPEKSAQKQGGSWVNYDQINEIVRWLKHDGARILDHYGVARLSEAVALIAPFRAQAMAMRSAVGKALGDDEANAMVINTVHALQGAEKPIVAFSLTQDEGRFFVDREGPNLLNVAVSRAKDCFILFASPSVLLPESNGKSFWKGNESTPLGLLIKYMNENGRRLYPREVVIIEAHGKIARIEEALGLSAVVVATGGHFRKARVVYNALQWETTNEETIKSLEQVTRDLRQIDAFYIATDDDDDGEEIAWHIQELLRSTGVDDINRIRRMRFYSLTPKDIRQARELALPGIDARRVRGNILRSLFELALHKQLESAGIQASRPELALLQEIGERQKEAGRWQLKVNGAVDQKSVIAFVVDGNTNSPVEYFDIESAMKAAKGIPSTIASKTKYSQRDVVMPRFPVATTAQTIISGYKRYQWPPQRTLDALNSLYLGHAAPKSFGVGIDDDDAGMSGKAS